MDIEDDTVGSGLADANAWLRERRLRRLERAPVARRRAAIAVVVLLHLLLVLGLRAGMRVRYDERSADEAAMVVRFDVDPATPIDPALDVVPPAASRVPTAAIPPRPRASREPGTADVAPRTSPTQRTTTSLRLFEPDGSLRLSREVVEAAAPKAEPEPEYRERAPLKKVWRADRPAIVHAPTRFERYWKPDQENLAQELVRKYPVLRIVLPNPGGKDWCPPRSLDPDCEGEVDPAFADDPFPDEWLE